jgi:hypothetical protein
MHRFSLGLDLITLVRSRDVVTIDTPTRARELIRAAGATTPEALARFAQEFGLSAADEEGITESALVERILGAELVLVRDDTPPRLGRANDTPLLDPIVPTPATTPDADTWLDLHVVHETGGLFAGARLVVEFADGELVDGALDDASRYRLDGIRTRGACEIRFYEPLRLGEEEQRRPSTGDVKRDPDDLEAIVGTAPKVGLATGRLHRLVVRLPAPAEMLAVDTGIFATGSVFATAALARAVDHLSDRLPDAPSLRLTAIAHADGTGDPDADKTLSDLRARCLRTLLINDVRDFEALAVEAGWSLLEDQAMLRGLGCNPAAIDGVPGPATQTAVEWFQEEWTRGIHHPDGLEAPLEVTGELDDATRSALRKAYLLSLSPQLAPSQLVAPEAIGCASFNIDANAPRPDRGGLAIWDKMDPRSLDFPCRKADPGACRIDERGAARCRFFRETFARSQHDEAPVFYDFEWLRLASGKINLSVVTSLPDDTRVRVHVFADVGDFDGRVRTHHGPRLLPPRGRLVGAPVDGIVRHGLCVALWTRLDDWDPFDWRQWLTDLDDDPDPDLPDFHPPLFAVEYDGGWAFSQPPGERIDRFALRHPNGRGLAFASDGSLVEFGARDHRIYPARAHRTDEHMRIVGWCAYRDFLGEEAAQ